MLFPFIALIIKLTQIFLGLVSLSPSNGICYGHDVIFGSPTVVSTPSDDPVPLVYLISPY